MLWCDRAPAPAQRHRPVQMCDKYVELGYNELSASCQNAVACSGLLNATSLADCEAKCDAQAAAAPGTVRACTCVRERTWPGRAPC